MPFFREGKAGMYLHGPFAISDYDAALGSDKYELIVAPAGPGGSTTVTERTSIYFGATSDRQDDLKLLAEFLISEEGQVLSMTSPGQPVVHLPVNINVNAPEVYLQRIC